MAAASPPMRRPRANGQRTSMGGLLGGSFDDDPAPGRGSPPGQAPQIVAPAPPVGGPQVPARPRPMSPVNVEKRNVLESNLAFPRPLPWAPAPPWAMGAQQEAPLPAAVAYPPSAMHQAPLEPPLISAAAMDVHLSARLATCERRLEAQQEQGERLQRVQAEIQLVKEGSVAQSRVSDERLASLERATEIGRREFTAASEQMRALQIDFREYTAQAGAKQRAEIEGEVGQALARQRASTEEWQAALRQQNVQLQGDTSRAVNNIERMGAQLAATTTELRTRLGAVEASGMAGRSARGGGEGAAGPMVEHMRQQLEAMRNTAAQASAGVVELQARLEGEAAARIAMQRDHDARLGFLGNALKSEREDLHESLAQRLQVLESRHGVERSDIFARQAELKQEVATGDQLSTNQVQDLAMRLRGEFEALERRLRAEDSALKERVDLQLAQLQTARSTEEDARRSSMASLFKRAEATAERQLEANRNLQQEIDAGFKQATDQLHAENAGRLEAERRLLTDTMEGYRTIAAEVVMLKAASHQQSQHLEVVNGEVGQLRRDSQERADNLSRYVDHVVSQVHADGAKKDNNDSFLDFEERLASLRTAVDEKAAASEKRLETVAEDLRLRLRRAEEARERDGVNMRRDSERAGAALERRIVATQEELRSRFEAYVRHFDSAIASVQSAILRPPQHAPVNEAGGPRSLASPNSRLYYGAGTAQPMSAHNIAQGGRASGTAEDEQLVFWVRIDRLRVYAAPDMDAEVQAVLSRGDVVISRGTINAQGRLWAQLMPGWPVAVGSQLVMGGYVVMNTDSGHHLLDRIEGDEAIRLIEAAAAARRQGGANLPAASQSVEDIASTSFARDGADGRNLDAPAASSELLEPSANAESPSATGVYPRQAATTDVAEKLTEQTWSCSVCSNPNPKAAATCEHCGCGSDGWTCVCTKLNFGAQCTQCGSLASAAVERLSVAAAKDKRDASPVADSAGLSPMAGGLGPATAEETCLACGGLGCGMCHKETCLACGGVGCGMCHKKADGDVASPTVAQEENAPSAPRTPVTPLTPIHADADDITPAHIPADVAGGAKSDTLGGHVPPSLDDGA